ncbi:hypothetical protein [Variovorax sp.]|uniref:hypothetical protein n=1 Tax=Variovorax sp. TaxID=1871043 RepID=UPI003BACF68D
MSSASRLPELSVTFTLEEYAMLARIVDAGMWELCTKPYTPADEQLWDRVNDKLGVPGYTAEDRAGNRERRKS